jgi:hypothetical protein
VLTRDHELRVGKSHCFGCGELRAHPRDRGWLLGSEGSKELFGALSKLLE